MIKILKEVFLYKQKRKQKQKPKNVVFGYNYKSTFYQNQKQLKCLDVINIKSLFSYKITINNIENHSSLEAEIETEAKKYCVWM